MFVVILGSGEVGFNATVKMTIGNGI